MNVLTFGNHEFEGENNAYLFISDDVVTLVDTGVATATTRKQLEAGLDERDLTFGDIDQIVLTHWHPDHTGLAGDIQSHGDAVVYIHEADAPLVRRDTDAMDELRTLQREYFDEWAMPSAEREALLSHLDTTEIVGRPPTVDSFTDGETIGIGDRELRVLHAPGHTAGLSCFVLEGGDEHEAFVGDALLPKYTPNVGGADVRVDRPLRQYLDTLERIADNEFTRVWPGHRDAIDTPTARARTIIDHHRERATRILDFLEEEGPADVWTVSAHLFGSLEGIHILHGPGEAYAHLDHLERHGLVETTPAGYRPVGDSPAVETII